MIDEENEGVRVKTMEETRLFPPLFAIVLTLLVQQRHAPFLPFFGQLVAHCLPAVCSRVLRPVLAVP